MDVFKSAFYPFASIENMSKPDRDLYIFFPLLYIFYKTDMA